MARPASLEAGSRSSNSVITYLWQHLLYEVPMEPVGIPPKRHHAPRRTPGDIYLEKVNKSRRQPDSTDNKDSSSGSSIGMNLNLLCALIQQLFSQISLVSHSFVKIHNTLLASQPAYI